MIIKAMTLNNKRTQTWYGSNVLSDSACRKLCVDCVKTPIFVDNECKEIIGKVLTSIIKDGEVTIMCRINKFINFDDLYIVPAFRVNELDITRSKSDYVFEEVTLISLYITDNPIHDLPPVEVIKP